MRNNYKKIVRILFLLSFLLTNTYAKTVTINGHSTISDNSISWTNINLTEKRPYNISFYYKSTSSKIVPLSVEIDGKKIENLDFTNSNGSNKWSYKITKLLDKGTHSLKIKTLHNRGDLPNIKSLKIEDSKPVQLIIDTDMLTDCDDSGALAVAHALEDNGEAKILAVMLSAHDYIYDSGSMDGYNSKTVSAINYYYNHNYNIPIGSYNRLIQDYPRAHLLKYFRMEDDHKFSRSHIDVARHHKNDGKSNRERKSSLELYSKILKNAEDNSIVIAVLGTNFNIASLMKQDRNLFSKKVKALVFPSHIGNCDKNMCTNVFKNNPNDNTPDEASKEASDYMINHMPAHIKMTFISGDNGDDIMTGYPKNNSTPMSTHYLKRNGQRNSWDQIAVLHAVRGNGYLNNNYWSIQDNGYISSNFKKREHSYWNTNRYLNHNYIKTAGSNTLKKMKNIIQGLMTQRPKSVTRFSSTDSKIYPTKEIISKGIPATPTRLNISKVTATTAQLRFYDNATNETNFYIFDASTNRSFKRVARKSGKGYVSITLTNLKKNRNYTIYVKAYNNNSKKMSSKSSNISFKTLNEKFTIAKITSPSASTKLPKRTTFRWNKNSASKVRLWVYDNTAKSHIHNALYTGTAATVTIPQNGHRIHVYVFSYDERGKEVKKSHGRAYSAGKSPISVDKPAELIAPKGYYIGGWTTFKWRKNSAHHIRFDIYDVTTRRYVIRQYTHHSSVKYNIPKNGHKLRIYLRSYKKNQQKQFAGKTYRFKAK